ncbi:hypothetical protein PoB_001017200 [Plakobranchus ocellatus]|uniref:Uncharacterized protein n=1 Tax=Plakobranchus ocellatus TaxID=259542 RepID=A0AAV3YMN5_9GAST|nr:hypothetical protein PoB_001017200 [Plakobranchus ocellatus]
MKAQRKAHLPAIFGQATKAELAGHVTCSSLKTPTRCKKDAREAERQRNSPFVVLPNDVNSTLCDNISFEDLHETGPQTVINHFSNGN